MRVNFIRRRANILAIQEKNTNGVTTKAGTSGLFDMEWIAHHARWVDGQNKSRKISDLPTCRKRLILRAFSALLRLLTAYRHDASRETA